MGDHQMLNALRTLFILNGNILTLLHVLQMFWKDHLDDDNTRSYTWESEWSLKSIRHLVSTVGSLLQHILVFRVFLPYDRMDHMCWLSNVGVFRTHSHSSWFLFCIPWRNQHFLSSQRQGLHPDYTFWTILWKNSGKSQSYSWHRALSSHILVRTECHICAIA